MPLILPPKSLHSPPRAVSSFPAPRAVGGESPGAAGDATREIHNRMPVILERADYARWLDPETEPAALSELLRPYDGGDLVCRPVGSGVGNVRNQGPSVSHQRSDRWPRMALTST